MTRLETEGKLSGMDRMFIRRMGKLLSDNTGRPLEASLKDAQRVFDRLRGLGDQDYDLLGLSEDEKELLQARLTGTTFMQIAKKRGITYETGISREFDSLLQRIAPEVLRDLDDIGRR